MIDYILRSELTRHPHPLLFVTISGAHLYGFPSPDSDYDLRGVHLLSAAEVLGLMPKQETIEACTLRSGVEIDLVTHDALKFFSLLLKRNGYVLEQLYSPLVVCARPEHEELKVIARRCITRHHSHHYLSYAAKQWGVVEQERPPRIKALLYVYRVLLTGIHLMRTGGVEANLVRLNESFQLPYLPELIARKTSGSEKQLLDATECELHASEYRRLSAELIRAAEGSELPEEPAAHGELNDLLVRLRLGHP